MESINILNEIQKESGTLDDIKIEHIMNFKDIITYEDNKISDNNIKRNNFKCS